MAKRWTHKECFEFFGTKPKNPRWSWSGRSEDGKTVAVTLWRDRFLAKGTLYQNFGDDIPGGWKSRPGFVELMENLNHARGQTGGIVCVIIAAPKDPLAHPRSIAECYPQKDLQMRVSALDLEAGTFTLERLTL